MSSTEEIVERIARQRSDLELVSYREVALPVFKVELDLLVLETKALPPIQEYVLRAVDLGLGAVEQIAGLLGIGEQVVQGAAAELISSDNLVLVGGFHPGDSRGLKLTDKGAQTAAEASQVQAVEVSLPVFVDGLTRKVLAVTDRRRRWFPMGEGARRGLVEIPPYPRRRPGLEEIPLEAVREKIAAESAGRRGRREVIGITGMGMARRFAEEAVALAFRASEEELQVTFAIDGETSEAHDAAFSQSVSRSARSLTTGKWQDVGTLLRGEVSSEVLAEKADTDRLFDERAELERENERLQAGLAQAQVEELAELRAQVEKHALRERELEAAIQNISVRQVEVYEHRGLLDRALAEAQERIVIISPWIAHEVVDDRLIGRFRKLLDREVELWIGYGINKSGEGQGSKRKKQLDREATDKLKRLSIDYPKSFRLKLLGDTHAKVLACDSRFAVITSFNWLSFRGDEALDFRDERGCYVGISPEVERISGSYAARIATGA
jgi:hypothetical protein